MGVKPRVVLMDTRGLVLPDPDYSRDTHILVKAPFDKGILSGRTAARAAVE